MSILLHITNEILHGIAEKHYKAIESLKRQTEFEQQEAARKEIYRFVDVDIPLTKKLKVLYPDLCVEIARSLNKESMVADLVKNYERRQQRRKRANIFRFIGNTIYFLFVLAMVLALIRSLVWLIYHLLFNRA